MATRFKIFLFALLIIPSTVLASDPTPLFVSFIEIPILVISCIVLLICFFAPNVGSVLLVLLLFGSFSVLAWASDVGYMSSAGNFLSLSFVVDIVGVIVIIRKKLSRIKESKPN